MPTTSYMTLILPTVSVTIGPEWATELNAALELVDAHDHTSGKGVRVPSAGLNVNADIACGGYRLTTLKATAYSQQAASLGATFTDHLYSVLGNLFYNDGSGNAVQLTAAGALNTSALSSASWRAFSVTVDKVIAPADPYDVFIVTTTSARAVTLPQANGVAAGRYYVITDKSGQSVTNNISIAPTGADLVNGVNAVFTAAAAYASWICVSDGVSQWQVIGLGGAALNLAGGAKFVRGILPSANLFQATASDPGAVQLTTDLGGSATTPAVLNLTGDSGIVTVRTTAAIFQWVDGIIPVLRQAPKAAAGVGADFIIQAQKAKGANLGGTLRLAGGQKDTGLKGGVAISINGGGGDVLLAAKEIAASRNAIGLGGDVDSTKVPSGSGVVFMPDLGTLPVLPPVGGCLIGAGGSSTGNLVIYTAAAGAGNSIEIPGTVSTTVGASGAADPCSAINPQKYLKFKHAGGSYKIPLYND